MYIKYYEDIDSVVNSIEFPPGGEGGFLFNKNWDTQLGIMHYQETFENITNPKAGLAITLFDPKLLHRERGFRDV